MQLLEVQSLLTISVEGWLHSVKPCVNSGDWILGAGEKEWQTAFLPSSWNSVFQHLECKAQKMSLVCLMRQRSQRVGEKRRTQKKMDSRISIIYNFYQKKKFFFKTITQDSSSAQHLLVMLRMLTSSWLDSWIMFWIFWIPRLFQMSSILERIFPRVFKNLYEVCSCLDSSYILLSCETSFPIINFSINTRNYFYQYFAWQLVTERTVHSLDELINYCLLG